MIIGIDNLTILKLSIFNLLFVIFLLWNLVKIYKDEEIYNEYMKKFERTIQDTNEKVSEIHLNTFNRQKKTKELLNFMIGIFIGISLALMIEASLDFHSHFRFNEAMDSAYTIHNISIQNLTALERADYTTQKIYFISSLVGLGISTLIGLITFVMAIYVYVRANRDLLINRYEYQYQLKKGITLLDLIDKDFNKFFVEFNKPSIEKKFDLDKEIMSIIIYRKFLSKISQIDYTCYFVIQKDRIIIYGGNTKFSNNVIEKLKKYLKKLRDKKLIIDFQLIKEATYYWVL